MWIRRKYINIRDYIRYDIPQGIRNLIRWFPVIWQDRNWDHYFFFNILHKKLSLMENMFTYHANYIGSEKDAKKIKTCRILTKRLIEDNYYNNLSNGKVFKLEGRNLWEKEDNMRDQDRKLLFTIIEKNILKWWD